jgi:hypothetical protein
MAAAFNLKLKALMHVRTNGTDLAPQRKPGIKICENPGSMKIRLAGFILVTLLAGCVKNRQNPGQSETNIVPSDFLSDNKYKTLYIDFLYDQGNPPSAETINNLKNFLNNRLNKSGGIQIVQREFSGNGKDKISIADVEAIEKKNRSYFSKGNMLGAFVYFVNSDYSDNQGSVKVLGMAYASTSIVIFGKTIHSYSGSFGRPSYVTLETTVAEHEFGHVMGLVNNGTSMLKQHLDASHDKHCSNTACLMYYAAETSDIVQNLLGGVPSLDQNCIDDLRNNGGK